MLAQIPRTLRSVRTALLVLATLNASAFEVPGEKAPKFYATSLDGEKFTNETIAGKVTMVEFWTTWCQYCRREQPILDSLSDEFKDKGLLVLAVDVNENRRKVEQYLLNSPRTCKVIPSEKTNLPAMFESKGFPGYVLIDRQGNIVARQNGAAGEQALRRMLAKAGLGSE